jgi:hypothetical protein
MICSLCGERTDDVMAALDDDGFSVYDNPVLCGRCFSVWDAWPRERRARWRRNHGVDDPYPQEVRS